ncbi:hypothetical protein BC834DRAFT_825103 [Gloeopeniophorella convolvens]|nr:hypothetical protein BC834DRAFT_825103 [Gloeopeniophorella convolvens]
MSADGEDIPRPIDKGKARAEPQEPTEETPLLASRSFTSPTSDDDFLETTSTSRRSLLSTLTTVFLVALSASVLLVLLLFFLAYSYAAKASHVSNDVLLDKALAFRGPDAINVLNITEHGEIWLKVDGRIGLDAGSLIDVKPDPYDGIWIDTWKAIGRWGIRRLDAVSVILSSVNITSQDDHTAPLATIEVPPLQVPLTADPPSSLSWLTPVSIPVHIRPSHNGSAWLKFARESWRQGYVVARATTDRATIVGGTPGSGGWRNALKVERPDVTVGLRMKIPILPGLPAPGRGLPLPSISDLVYLEQFTISSDADRLTVGAEAFIVNPAPSSISFNAPPLPFVVWIPHPENSTTDTSLIPLASVTSEPFTLTHPNITLSLHGAVLPLDPTAAPALSALISDYLSGTDHLIAITSPLALFAGYTAHTRFPAPHPRPEVLRNVSLDDMRIRPVGTAILASGHVRARVVLPPGMDVALDVRRVLPDVLIFDGPLSDDFSPPTPSPTTTVSSRPAGDDDDVPPAPPLPSPLPPRAFARVRPSAWLAANSSPDTDTPPSDGEGRAVRISATLTDVPLEVLPGREREFRSFVGKVIFGAGGGALAGVQGVAAVGVHVEGMPLGSAGSGGMVLTGLPFQGSVRVGKR